MPSPLHPAIVHFPIVLIVLGTLVTLPAAFTPRWHLRWIAAILLALGAAGAGAALATGEEDGEAVEQVAGIDTVLDQHEQWADRTLGFSVVAAVCALVAAGATTHWPRFARGASLAGLGVAAAATFAVVQTGHYGGQLVYRHGAGVNLASTTSGGETKGTVPARAKRHDDDDDN